MDLFKYGVAAVCGALALGLFIWAGAELLCRWLAAGDASCNGDPERDAGLIRDERRPWWRAPICLDEVGKRDEEADPR